MGIEIENPEVRKGQTPGFGGYECIYGFSGVCHFDHGKSSMHLHVGLFSLPSPYSTMNITSCVSKLQKLLVLVVFWVGIAAPTIASAVTPMVAGGNRYSVALRSDGTVMAWGDGQLGDGTSASSQIPVAVPGLTGVVAIGAGRFHTVALKSDGTVMAWGSNYSGQLGDGTTTDRLSPVTVLSLTGVVAVAAGDRHTVALKADGTVMAWGDGQLGDGTSASSPIPVAVPGLTGVVAVTAGASHTVALKSDGTVMAWGRNYSGQLGDGTTTDRLSPVTVLSLTWVVAVSAGVSHTVALKSDGTVVAWGENFYGGLGDGTTIKRLAPVAVPGLNGVVLVAAGGWATAALKSDSTVAVWGSDHNNGNWITRSNPLTVQGLTGVATVAQGGSAFTLALKTDGTVWAWGDNSGGQLGTPQNFSMNNSIPAMVTGGLNLGITTPAAVLSPASLTFTAQDLGTSSAAQTLTLTNTGSRPLHFLGIVSSKDYSRTTTCGTILAVGENCTVSVTFNPTQTGVRGGSLTIVGNGAILNSVSLIGTGLGEVQTIGVVNFSSNTLFVGATTTASAAATSGLAVTFTSTTPSVCTVSGSTVIAIATGTCTLAANQAGNANFNAAPPVTQSIASLALDFTRLLPHAAGSQWSYINNNQVTTTTTTGSPVTLPGGVVAIPWTRVDSSQPGYTVTYNTFDANGWRRHQEYMSSVYVSGYGYTSATAVYTPAVMLVPANAAIGSTYTATGVVTITYTNVTTVTLNYSGTTQIVGFETVSNSAGTQSWSALKGIISITLSGMVNGAFFTTTSSSTAWLADGLGVVQNYTPNASGTMETWKLTSTNVVTPVTIGSATAGNSSATVSFYAPASNGGSTLTGYTVTSAPGGITASGTASPIIVTGLTNGTTYTFTVKANYNTVGGASSAPSNSVTPAGPAVSLSAPSLTFLAWPQATSSSAQTITLTNSGNASLTISSITASGDFARSTNCGGTLAAGASCTVSVTFTPTTASVRSGTLSIASDASGTAHDVSLSGTGTPAVLDVPITLRQGWNLLGNSLNQTLSVSTLFSDPAVVSTVWKWESAASRWQFFTPLMDATALQTYANGKGYGVLGQIAPGEGYWVNAKVAANLATQTGQAFILTSANLASGWNLVATGQDISPATFNRSLSETPPSPGVVPQNLTSLWAWDNPANGWYFYAPGLEVQGGTALTDYITSKGYRDFTQHNRKLGNGAGFWVNRPQQ